MRRTELDFMGAACEFFAYFLATQKVKINSFFILFSSLYKKKTPAFAGVYKTQFFRIYLASAASSAFASGLASAIFSSTVVKGLICTLIVAVTVGFK